MRSFHTNDLCLYSLLTFTSSRRSSLHNFRYGIQLDPDCTKCCPSGTTDCIGLHGAHSCCPSGTTCCGDLCCPSNTTCCGSVCCAPGIPCCTDFSGAPFCAPYGSICCGGSSCRSDFICCKGTGNFSNETGCCQASPGVICVHLVAKPNHPECETMAGQPICCRAGGSDPGVCAGGCIPDICCM